MANTKNIDNSNTNKQEKQSNYVYMLRLNDKSLYTGWTNNLEKRLATHRAGKGSKCVRARLPFELVCVEEFATKEEAMKREYEIKKKMTKEEKEALVGVYANK